MPSVIEQYCDIDYANGVLAAGKPRNVKIGGLERVVILCEEHDKAIVVPLVELMQEHGVRPETVAQPTRISSHPPQSRVPRDDLMAQFATKPLPDGMTWDDADKRLAKGRCLYCEEYRVDTASSDKRGAVRSHMLNVHDASLVELGLGMRGTTREQAREMYERRQRAEPLEVAESLACDVEGCERADFTTAQGLSVHKSRSHGIKGAATK